MSWFFYADKRERKVRAWLKGSDSGRRLLEELFHDALEERCRACKEGFEPLPRVLVVIRRLFGKPGVEVFAEPRVLLRLEELIDTEDNPAIEALAEELLVAQLPRSWKHLPECRMESMVFRALSAERRLRALWEVEMIRALKEVSREV